MGKAVPAIICFLLMFVPLASAATGGLRLENDRFVIRYTVGDDGLAAELVRDSLRIRERVIADIGVDFAEKTEIRLSPTIEAFREAQPGGIVDSPLGRGCCLSRAERHRSAFAAGNQGEPDECG